MKWEIIRENDEHGLVQAGLKWTEPRGMSGLYAFLFLIGSIICGFVGQSVGAALPFLLLAILCWHFGSRARYLILHRSGLIQIRPTLRNLYKSKTDFPNLLLHNFEPRQRTDVQNNDQRSLEVILQTPDGYIETVASRVNQNEAHYISVQLNKALAEIRETQFHKKAAQGS